MGNDLYRQHKAVQVVLVPVPCGGSPEPFRQVKPHYPVQQRREHWRPATRPPSRADATMRLLRDIAANEAAARAMLRPQPPATVTR
jgi:hypothetical protein